MPYFAFRNKQIFYEDDGQGLPILFLNGIMMSTASWKSFVPALSKDNRFIRLDFLDMGQSARMEEQYTQDIQVEVVKALLTHLGLDSINIMGISYGGEVAIKYALKYGKDVRRLMLFNTTSRTNEWLRDIGRGWNKVGETLDGEAYYDVTIPVIYSSNFYVANHEWMEKRRKLLVPYFSSAEFQSRMRRLVISAESLDESKNIDKIDVPTLIVSSEFDQLTPSSEQVYLAEHIKNSTHIIVPKAGHAFMYEKPHIFVSLVLGFTNSITDQYVI
ncbi:MAG: alpha/beta hydrolase [Bacteroidia bacterium]|nr:alpha/beta hydrolase [Bacteroidia bacterium]